MGWFDKTILGRVVTPFDKKVEIFLKEAYEYEVPSHLKSTLESFISQHRESGFNHELTGVFFMAVIINSLGNDGSERTKDFVISRNRATIAMLGFLSINYNEIKDVYIDASAKHINNEGIDSLWNRNNEDSYISQMIQEFNEL